MVAAHHRLLVEQLGVDHLRLVMGTSMGGMHTWVWGETLPGIHGRAHAAGVQPRGDRGPQPALASMIVDAIHSDPEWKDGEYASEPRASLRTAQDLLIIAGSAPIFMQNTLANARHRGSLARSAHCTAALATLDANDLLYQVEASRNYDPSPRLETITAPVMFVNSADDFINPPELGDRRARGEAREARDASC